MNHKELREKIKSLSCLLEFNLNDEELQKIVDEYESIEESLQKISKINIKDIEPTSFVHQVSHIKNWQEDELIDYQQEKVFKNCQKFKNSFVEIKNEK